MENYQVKVFTYLATTTFQIYFYSFYYEYVHVSVWVCAHERRCPQREEASDPLALQLQVIVSCLMSILWKSSMCSKPLSYLFSVVITIIALK